MIKYFRGDNIGIYEDIEEDPRLKLAKRVFLGFVIFYGLYTLAVWGPSYILGMEKSLFGLPQWVAIPNVIVPWIFVGALIVVVELFVPDFSLEEHPEEETLEELD